MDSRQYGQYDTPRGMTPPSSSLAPVRRKLDTPAAMFAAIDQAAGQARLRERAPVLREMMRRGQLTPAAARVMAWFIYAGADASVYYGADNPRSPDYHSRGNVWAPFLTDTGTMRSVRVDARHYSDIVAGWSTRPDGLYVPAVPTAAGSLLLLLDTPAHVTAPRAIARRSSASSSASGAPITTADGEAVRFTSWNDGEELSGCRGIVNAMLITGGLLMAVAAVLVVLYVGGVL